jgi:SAM-dependent methyltransferase
MTARKEESSNHLPLDSAVSIVKRKSSPWWAGYLLVSPLRRLVHDPSKILAPYVYSGMTVLEPGPGMGFFTIEIARLTGPAGHVIAVDAEPRMIEGLKRRARKAGLLDTIDARCASPQSMKLDGLDGTVDFTFAFAAVHEMPSPSSFFAEAARAMKSGAKLLLAEPDGHVSKERFDRELAAAWENGFILDGRPHIDGSLTVLLRKPGLAD